MSADLPPQSQSTAPEWSETTARGIALLFAGVLALTALTLWSVIPLMFAAVVTAYLLHPLVDACETRVARGQRVMSVFIIMLLIVGLLVGLMISVVPALLRQTNNVLTVIPGTVTTFLNEPLTFGDTVIETPDGEPFILSEQLELMVSEEEYQDFNDYLNTLLGQVTGQGAEEIFNSVLGITGSAFGVIGNTIGFLLTSLFFFLIVGHLLIDGRAILRTIVSVAPDGYQEDVRRLLRDLATVWNDYLRGKVILSLIIGSAMWVLATVLGIPNATFLAFFAGIMEFIPNVGPALSLIPAALTALFVDSSTIDGLGGFPLMLVVIVLWFVIQQIEGLFLVPRVLGNSLHLHPAIVILSVLWGASFGGVVGVIIAAPLIASARILGQYVYGRLTGRAAFRVMEMKPLRRAPISARLYGLFRRRMQPPVEETAETAT